MHRHARSEHIPINRRSFLGNLATSAGGVALAQLLAKDGLLAAEGKSPIRPVIDPSRPYASRQSHHPAKADQLLIIFCAGAVSHLDTWDYKPELYKHHGQTPPNAPKVTFEGPIGKMAQPFWKFRPRGESGKMISDLTPNLAELADDICFIHSMTAKNSAHTQAENFMSTGFTFEGYPSLGAWTTYALGTWNEDLPAFVAIADPRGRSQAGPNNWGNGFLPAAFQGTAFSADEPPKNLHARARNSANRATVDLLKKLNERHRLDFPSDTELAARISSYELAGRMQTSIPDLMNLSAERQATLEAYGATSSNPTKAAYARNCLMARRLLEQGVRVVQLFNGAYASGGKKNWDSHKEIYESHGTHAEILDQPTTALLRDLKQRGQLDRTLVVWCTEFGRLPFMQANGTGRDHNIEGFTCWLMGAGVKSGFSYGGTDELGWHAVENKVTHYDFNATILHLLGLDHERLTYYFNGNERRLTDVHGHVIKEVLV